MDFLNSPLKDNYRWRDLIKLGHPLDDYKKIYKVDYKPWSFVNKKLKVGIEVEVENVIRGLPDLWPNEIWRHKEDGSLRNGGMEFITPPISDDEIGYAVNWLFTRLPSRADFSERTSIHVHMNCRNRTEGDILNMMLLYIVFEKLLYKFAGPERYKNIFCIPIQETKLPIVLSNYLVNGRFGDLLHGWAKYSGLNLLPLKTFGTIEFRHMQGHRDSEYLLNWINILQRLYGAACGADFNNLFNQIKVLNSTSMYEQFLQSTFKDQAKHFDRQTLQDDMEYGVSVVKAIQPPTTFIMKLLDGISNDSPLLKSLGLDETKTRKVKQMTKEIKIGFDDVEQIADIMNWNAGPNLGRILRDRLDVRRAPAPVVHAPGRIYWDHQDVPRDGMWVHWPDGGDRIFFQAHGGWLTEAAARGQGLI